MSRVNFNEYCRRDNGKSTKAMYAVVWPNIYNGKNFNGEAIFSISTILNALSASSHKDRKLGSNEQTDFKILFKKHVDSYLEKNNIVRNELEERHVNFIETLSFVGTKVNSRIYDIFKDDDKSLELKEVLAYYAYCIRRYGNYMPLYKGNVPGFKISLNSDKGLSGNNDDPVRYYNKLIKNATNNNWKIYFKQYKVNNVEEFLELFYLKELLDYTLNFKQCKEQSEYIQYMSTACLFINQRHEKLLKKFNQSSKK